MKFPEKANPYRQKVDQWMPREWQGMGKQGVTATICKISLWGQKYSRIRYQYWL